MSEHIDAAVFPWIDEHGTVHYPPSPAVPGPERWQYAGRLYPEGWHFAYGPGSVLDSMSPIMRAHQEADSRAS